MERYTGKSVLKGVAVGRVFCYQKQDYHIEKEQIADIDGELARFKEAVEMAKEQLTALYDQALANVGEDHAMIFDIHRMMLIIWRLLSRQSKRVRTLNMPWRWHRISSHSCLPPWMMST